MQVLTTNDAAKGSSTKAGACFKVRYNPLRMCFSLMVFEYNGNTVLGERVAFTGCILQAETVFRQR